MNNILICLLTLLFSLSGPAMAEYSDFCSSPLAAKGVATPYGAALQSEAAAAAAARAQVAGGSTLYRVGTTGRSAAGEAQFWALEHPLSPGFASRYGLPAENVAAADFIETATLKPGTSFVTRPAPGIGANPGGGIEVVVPSGGVRLDKMNPRANQWHGACHPFENRNKIKLLS